MKEFKAEPINVPSVKLVCVKCSAERQDIVMFPTQYTPQGKAEKILIVCKKCHNLEEMAYEDYLKDVKLDAV